MVENQNENIKQITFHPHSTRYSEKRKPESNVPLIKDNNIAEDNTITKDISKNEKPTNAIESCQKAFVSTVKKRTWEQWSIEEMNMFFDALTIHGKNFDNIWKYMFGKMGKNMIRNREQIRHFYYRTWAKLSKYIKGKDSSNLKHNYIELYTLLSYGELRRKVGFNIDETRFQRLVRDNLSQLALNGSTCMKLKGKKMRIKLPTCLALKKILSLQSEKEGSSEEKKANVPQAMTVLLWPQSNADWAYVQSLSHNPRIKFKLHPSVRVADVIKVLEKKWQSKDLQLVDAFHHEFTASHVDGLRDKGHSLARVGISLRLARSHFQASSSSHHQGKGQATPSLPTPKAAPRPPASRWGGGEIGGNAVPQLENLGNLDGFEEGGGNPTGGLWELGVEERRREEGARTGSASLGDKVSQASGEPLEDLLGDNLPKLTFADLYNVLASTENINLEYKIEDFEDGLGKDDSDVKDKKIFHQLFHLALSESCDKLASQSTAASSNYPTQLPTSRTALLPSQSSHNSEVNVEGAAYEPQRSAHPPRHSVTSNHHLPAPISTGPSTPAPQTITPTTFVFIKPYPQATAVGLAGSCQPASTISAPLAVVSPKTHQPPRRYRGRLRRSALKQVAAGSGPKTIAPKPIPILTAALLPILAPRAAPTTFYALNNYPGGLGLDLSNRSYVGTAGGVSSLVHLRNMVRSPALTPGLSAILQCDPNGELGEGLAVRNALGNGTHATTFQACTFDAAGLATTSQPTNASYLANLISHEPSHISHQLYSNVTPCEPTIPTYVNCLMDLSLPALAEQFEGAQHIQPAYPPATGETPGAPYNKNEKLIDLALGELSWLSSHISLPNDELSAFKMADDILNLNETDSLFFRSVAKSGPGDSPYEDRPHKILRRSDYDNSSFACVDNEISITELMEVSSALKLLPQVGDESQTTTFGTTEHPTTSTPTKTSPNFKGLIVSENSMDFASTFLSLNVKKE